MAHKIRWIQDFHAKLQGMKSLYPEDGQLISGEAREHATSLLRALYEEHNIYPWEIDWADYHGIPLK